MFYTNPLLECTGLNFRVPVKHLYQDDLFGLIRRMMKTQKADRIPIKQIGTKFESLKRNSLINMNSFAQIEIERIATQNLHSESHELIQYISNLDHIS